MTTRRKDKGERKESIDKFILGIKEERSRVSVLQSCISFRQKEGLKQREREREKDYPSYLSLSRGFDWLHK